MAVAQAGNGYLKIGEIARESGVGVEALRFYESRGLIEPVTRSRSGYRLYDASALSRLRFIKKAQSIGFTLDEIAQIISESAHGHVPCADVRRLAAEKLTALEERIRQLQRYRRELRETVDAWEQQGEIDGEVCGLIEGLSDAPARPPRRKL
jgi:MerR family transcriptional regulator, copper efflux regulator